MWLAVDAGNSRIKWATVEDDKIVSGGATEYRRLSPLTRAAATAGQAWVSDVRQSPGVRKCLHRLSPKFLRSEKAACGVRNTYCPPESLGADRWLSLIAARHRCKGDLIVVSAGTAVTIDALRRDGRFLGGVICPGARLMLNSLRKHTLLSDAAGRLGDSPRLPPRKTEDGMIAGTMLAVAAAVESFRGKVLPAARILVGGGDAEIILPWLEEDARPAPNLVLEGIIRRRRAEL